MGLFSYIKLGSITSPKGFIAFGDNVGIKKRKLDASLIYSKEPCVAAAMFTQNKAKAWPVLYCLKAIKNKVHKAILCNSGNANCFNGDIGEKTVKDSVKELSKQLNVSSKEILVCSTGVIGRAFPLKIFLKGISKLVKGLSRKGSHSAAEGILTTDKLTKELAIEMTLSGKKVRVGAIAKGAGMVHPNMATMLCFITTDLNIQKTLLQAALKEAVSKTFNRIAIDNDMSTNDTVIALANGLAGNKKITSKNSSYEKLVLALSDLCKQIAFKLVDDGEGVTHVCDIHVEKASSEKKAEAFARQVGNSMLVKTMLTGADPNWGRVIGALGAVGQAIKWEKLEIYFDKHRIFKQGHGENKNLAKVKKILKKKHYSLRIVLNEGRQSASFLTSDLTSKYVRINSAYTT